MGCKNVISTKKAAPGTEEPGWFRATSPRWGVQPQEPVASSRPIIVQKFEYPVKGVIIPIPKNNFPF